MLVAECEKNGFVFIGIVCIALVIKMFALIDKRFPLCLLSLLLLSMSFDTLFSIATHQFIFPCKMFIAYCLSICLDAAAYLSDYSLLLPLVRHICLKFIDRNN